MEKFLNDVAYYVMVALTTLFAIPGIVIGTIVYFVLSIPFAIASRNSLRDYIRGYKLTIKTWFNNYKINILEIGNNEES